MRTTWDALASAETALVVGDPARAGGELESLFSRLGGNPRGGTCVEVGCGPGRMTIALGRRFERVLAVDVSPAMLARAEREAADHGAGNVSFAPISGERLDGIPDGVADTLVCYLVLQHLPSRALVLGLLGDFARVLAPRGEAYVQLPVLEPVLPARAWRAARALSVPLIARLSGDPLRGAAFRGFRLTEAELRSGLEEAGLAVRASDVGPDAPYRFSRDLFLRLARAA